MDKVLENKKKTLDYYKEVVEYFEIPPKDSKATSSL